MSSGLTRGLKILECIAKADGQVGFGEINSALGNISRATLSRLLKDLIDEGYVHKDNVTGFYSAGYKMDVFNNVSTRERRDHLVSCYASKMKKLARTCDLTVILMEKVGNVLVNIHREKTDYSMFMQEVNNLNDSPEEPWLLTLAAYHPDIANFYKDSLDLNLVSDIREKGYYLEDQTRRPNVRRMAFPIRYQGEVIAILGIGGNISQFGDDIVEKCIKDVKSF